jgi:hypothetical protein
MQVSRQLRRGCPTLTQPSTRNRKLKCDEAKPNCDRCVKSGRICLGYTSSPPFRHGDSSPDSLDRLQLPRLPLSPAATDEESELLRFFSQHAASGLAGILDAEFWTSTLPQLSSSWQSVRFSLLSISAFTRVRCRLVHGQMAVTCSGTKGSRAATTGTKFYRKALAATRSELGVSNRKDLAVLTCILFFCIECLQGRQEGALALCRSGQAILDHLQQTQISETCFYPRLMRSLNWMFARVRIVAVLHGHRMARLPLPAIRMSEGQESFSNLCEARWILLNLTTDVLSLQERAAEICLYGRGSVSEIATIEENRSELLQALKHWRGRAANFLVVEDFASRHQRLARLVLHCHDLVSEMLLKCLLATSELNYDDFKSSFKQIVQNSTEIIDLKSKEDLREYSYTHFQLEAGVMLPLFLTACKCRDMKLRMEALDLIQQGPEQEGLWERERLVKVAHRVMEIEAKGSSGSSVPGEYGRVMHFHMDSSDHRTTTAGRPIVRVSFVQRLRDHSKRIWEESLIY